MKVTLANQITIGRILLIPVFIATVLYYSPEHDYLRFWALAVFCVAIASDALDGYLARVRNEQTKAGALLDPVADKVLLISGFLAIYKINYLFESITFPIWLLITVISRDVILLVGSIIILVLDSSFEIQPTFLGKTTTVAQMSCIIGILIQSPVSPVLWYITLILSIATALDYIYKGIKIINRGSSYDNTIRHHH